MNTTELNKRLSELERHQGIWLLNHDKMRLAFPEESENTLKISIRRHIAAGNLQRVAHGLYVRPRAATYPLDAIGVFLNHIRPNGLTYLSLEYRLSELGIISQVPTLGTFVTTGSAGKYSTPFGDVELVHTKRSEPSLWDDLTFDQSRGFFVASPALAYKDMKLANRSNISLVDLDELAEVIDEESCNGPPFRH